MDGQPKRRDISTAFGHALQHRPRARQQDSDVHAGLWFTALHWPFVQGDDPLRHINDLAAGNSLDAVKIRPLIGVWRPRHRVDKHGLRHSHRFARERQPDKIPQAARRQPVLLGKDLGARFGLV
jgi:hypothetical protein